MGKTSDLSDWAFYDRRCQAHQFQYLRKVRPCVLFTHNSVQGLPRMVQQTTNIQSVAALWAKTARWWEVEGEWQESCNRRATNSEIMAPYNSGVQNSILELTTHKSFSRMGYGSRRPHRVPLLSAKNKKRLQWARVHRYWTIEERKNIAWSDESRCLLRHADSRVRIWRKQH
jgi:hypothetical protein